jgi:hypothetical protein
VTDIWTKVGKFLGRAIALTLMKELQSKIPVVFDDIYTYWPNDDQFYALGQSLLHSR